MFRRRIFRSKSEIGGRIISYSGNISHLTNECFRIIELPRSIWTSTIWKSWMRSGVAPKCMLVWFPLRIHIRLNVMGWLRLVGSLQTWVSFAKEPYKSDLYSAKETYNFKEPTNRSHPIPLATLLSTFRAKSWRACEFVGWRSSSRMESHTLVTHTARTRDARRLNVHAWQPWMRIFVAAQSITTAAHTNCCYTSCCCATTLCATTIRATTQIVVVRIVVAQQQWVQHQFAQQQQQFAQQQFVQQQFAYIYDADEDKWLLSVCKCVCVCVCVCVYCCPIHDNLHMRVCVCACARFW